jgi:Rne/Rng family ribonuclease
LEEKLVAHAEAAPLFEVLGVEAAIEAALAPRVALPSGGSLIVEATAALIAIDVNTGGHAQGGGPEETALRVNLEAADEIARQMRLRNLAGAFAVDFVPMKRRPNQAEVLARLRAAVAADRVPTHVLGFTPLGLIEMTRQRRGESLAERLTADCPACSGAGRVKNPLTVGAEMLRRALREGLAAPAAGLVVTAAPAAVAALEGPLAAARRETEARLGAPLKLVADAALAADAYRITTTRDGG